MIKLFMLICLAAAAMAQTSVNVSTRSSPTEEAVVGFQPGNSANQLLINVGQKYTCVATLADPAKPTVLNIGWVNHVITLVAGGWGPDGYIPTTDHISVTAPCVTAELSADAKLPPGMQFLYFATAAMTMPTAPLKGMAISFTPTSYSVGDSGLISASGVVGAAGVPCYRAQCAAFVVVEPTQEATGAPAQALSGPGALPSTGTIYILATGQSNVTGRNDGSGESSVNTNVQMLQVPSYTWVTAREGVLPFGGDNPGGFSGSPNSNNATWHFAKSLQAATGLQVKIIMLSWGGQPISQWVGAGVSSTFYAQIRTAMAAIGNPAINYFIWDQGEADTGLTSGQYLTSLNTLISQLRAETWFPATTPIILTGLPASAGSYGSEYAQWGLAAGGADPYVYFANTELQPVNVGDVHYTGPATVAIGGIYFSGLSHGGTQNMLTADRTQIAASAASTWPQNVAVFDTDTSTAYQWDGSTWVQQ